MNAGTGLCHIVQPQENILRIQRAAVVCVQSLSLNRIQFGVQTSTYPCNIVQAEKQILCIMLPLASASPILHAIF